MSVHSNKILVQLKIRNWAGKSVDDAVTQQSLALFNGTTGDGSFTKVLIHEHYTKDLRSAAVAARNTHRKYSLPWLPKGIDIITSSAYHDYVNAMSGPIDEFKKAAAAFCEPSHYASVVEAQKSRLKSAWSITDYPTPDEIPSMFSINLNFFPFPDAKDWRLDLAEEEAALIRQETELSIREAIYDASKEAIERYKAALSAFVDKMATFGPKNKMHKTIITNITDLADLLPKLNIAGDPLIDIAAAEIRTKLQSLSVDNLKEDSGARHRAMEDALEIIKRLS